MYSGIEKIQSGIGDKVAVFLSYFSTFLTAYVIGFVRSWKIALVVMTMLPLIALVTGAISKVRLNQATVSYLVRACLGILSGYLCYVLHRLLRPSLLVSRVHMQLLELLQRRCCLLLGPWLPLEGSVRRL